MKTNKLIAAGIAAAGASAVALTAVAPAALTAAPDAVAPAQSHEIVLTGIGDFDVRANLKILWNSIAEPAELLAGMDLGALAGALDFDALAEAFKDHPLTTTVGLAAVPVAVPIAVDTVFSMYRTPAILAVAGNLDTAGLKVAGAQLRGQHGLTQTLKHELVVGPVLSATQSAASLALAIESGDPEGVVNTIATQRLNLRSAFAEYETTGLSKGKLKSGNTIAKLRGAVDSAGDGVTDALVSKLPSGVRSNVSDAVGKVRELRGKVRDAFDKNVGSKVKAALDKVDNKVKADTE